MRALWLASVSAHPATTTAPAIIRPDPVTATTTITAAIAEIRPTRAPCSLAAVGPMAPTIIAGGAAVRTSGIAVGGATGMDGAAPTGIGIAVDGTAPGAVTRDGAAMPADGAALTG